MLWSSRHLSSLFRRSSSLLHLLQLHSLILKTALDHRPSVASKLISSLCPFSLAHARSVLSNLVSPPPLLAWNSLIRAYADSDSPQEAIHLFSALRRAGNGRPDNLSYPFVLRACGRAFVLRVGEMVHGVVFKAGFLLDLYVGNTLLHMYACCGVSKCAREVFDEMGVRDVVTWSSMIQGYLACYLGSPCTGRAIHSYIVVNNIKLDVALGAALVSMYAKCGLLEEAFQVFKSLQEQDLQSWTIMIAGFVDHGQWEKAIDLFSQMEASGVRPDSTIFSVILCACSHLGMVDVGQTMFSRMVNEFHIEPAIEHYGCMVDLFGRAGLLETAYEFIKNMSIAPNNVILRSFLGACRKSGKSFDIGDDLLKLLLEEEPDLGSNYVIAANMSALSGKWNNVAELRSNISKKGLKKVPACSWVEGNAEVPELELLETSG
ncbi:hypothetical protein BHM03_00057328 [Ensete ventricosum]|nr:hypothetical protein BHM03_00057328 [Ensete ventricosum]